MMVYIACTPDKYELPIAVADTTKELAQMLGVKENSIQHALSRHGRRRAAGKPMKWTKWRIYRIEI